jgi:hypothetical protein
VHPSFDLVNLRPADFKPKVSDLAWLPGGQLVVLDWGGVHGLVHERQFEGKIYLVDGAVEAQGPDDIDYSLFTEGLEDPLGLAVVGDTIYSVGGQYLQEHIDADKDGAADATNDIFDFNYPDHCRHSFFMGLVYKDPYFHVTASRCKDEPSPPRPAGTHGNTWQMYQGRGGHYRIHRHTGDMELIAGGFREPYGMSPGPGGDVFECDNQGNWLPASKLIHIQPGRFYGFHADNFTPEEDYGPEYAGVSESPPAVYFPHNVVGESPGHPLYVEHGLYRGQMLVGDVTYGGIQRVFMEKVNGEWQGCLFRFTGGLEAGTGTVIWGPDSALYAGGIGGDGGWDHRLWWGLQKLVPNGESTFEMLAIRSREKGMELEFTREVAVDADQPAKYMVRQWHYRPTLDYGGPNHGEEALTVKSVRIHEDRKRVFLEMDGLKTGPLGHVVYIRLNELQSAAGELVWDSEAWYTLVNISQSQPFEVRGCMDRSYAEYNPGATVDDGSCQTLDVSLYANPARFQGKVTVSGRTVNISIASEGPHAVEVMKLDGSGVFSHAGDGIREYDLTFPSGGNVYLFSIRAGEQKTAGKIVLHR